LSQAEDGFSTVQFVAATALSLVVFVALANFVVDLYARGAVRAALDEGVRAGEPIDAPASACEQRAADALDALLGGAMRSSVRVQCVVESGLVFAHADVDLRGWVPGITPDWEFALTAVGTKERDP
jgi:hypothetical protein